MPFRYTDADSISNGSRDFIIRQRSPNMPQLLAVFFSVLLVTIILCVSVLDRWALVMLLFVLLATFGWYAMLQIQRNRDLLLTTEFQNALFASALGIDNKFCLIVKRDGNIVYIDPSFQELFPDFIHQPRRTVEMLLEYGKVSKQEGEKIFSAMERGVYDKVIFEIGAAEGKSLKVVMSLEPILRPSGFILLRGREYVEQRQAPPLGQALPAVTHSSVTLFSHVMESMHMGMYMSDPAGGIVFANPLLEHALGYHEGEMVSLNLRLADVISYGNAGEVAPSDFEGAATLRSKSGGAPGAFINQKIIRDEQGKTMGCTALVQNIAGEDEKKKIW